MKILMTLLSLLTVINIGLQLDQKTKHNKINSIDVDLSEQLENQEKNNTKYETIHLLEISYALDDMKARFDMLEKNQRAIIQNIISDHNNRSIAISDDTSAAAISIESASDAELETLQLPDSISESLAFGLLDEQSWTDMHQDITTMSKQENKAFWMQLTTKLESGEVYVTQIDESEYMK